MSRFLGPRAVGGVLAYGVGVFAAFELSQPKPPCPSCEARRKTFSTLAPKYDEEISRDEATSGILDMRKELAGRALGRVLEVAGGTGRNLDFYDGSSVTELFITDYSDAMLQVAASKVALQRDKQPPSDETARRPVSTVTLAVCDAGSIPLPSASFDTVVDTFGLCSFERPEEALREMQRCVKPGGRILLLEHGASDWRLLAWWQQHRLNRHVIKWGCYWNRDILGLVRESGLDIREVRRRHLGTTYLIDARVAVDAKHG